MQIKLNPAGAVHMQLQTGQVISTPRLEGLAIEALRGTVWITFASEGVDHVLKPGERLQLGTAGKAVLEALEPVELSLFALPAASRRPDAFSRLTRRVVNRLGACLADLPVCTRNWVHTQSPHRLSLETL